MPAARLPSTRLYVTAPLTGDSLALDAEQAHYLGRVLRCRDGEQLIAFNGEGRERIARITLLAKREARIELGEPVAPIPAMARELTLLQALVKSDAMDLIVQKATELGVARIVAVRTERSVVRLDGERVARRHEHWRRIAISACEQSGRHRPTDIEIHAGLDQALAATAGSESKLVLALGATAPLAPPAGSGSLCAAVGPEGGFTRDEIRVLREAGFSPCSLGPRTLRAETAAITACAGLGVLA